MACNSVKCISCPVKLPACQMRGGKCPSCSSKPKK
jgi:hypothetical protein